MKKRYRIDVEAGIVPVTTDGRQTHCPVFRHGLAGSWATRRLNSWALADNRALYRVVRDELKHRGLLPPKL